MKKGVLPPFYIASVLLQPHCDSICILILTWTLLAHISVTLCDLGQPSISDILDIIIYHCIHCISYFICISEALVGWVDLDLCTFLDLFVFVVFILVVSEHVGIAHIPVGVLFDLLFSYQILFPKCEPLDICSIVNCAKGITKSQRNVKPQIGQKH